MPAIGGGRPRLTDREGIGLTLTVPGGRLTVLGGRQTGFVGPLIRA